MCTATDAPAGAWIYNLPLFGLTGAALGAWIAFSKLPQRRATPRRDGASLDELVSLGFHNRAQPPTSDSR